MRTIRKGHILRLLARVLALPQRIREKLDESIKREACAADRTALLLPECSIINFGTDRERIHIGAHSISRGEFRVISTAGSIRIGSYCYIGDHTRIWSCTGVTIGDRVLIAHGVNIHDNDAHPASASERHKQTIDICYNGKYPLKDVGMSPVVIEDDAWVGFNASILKGVRIGRGAIIGACSVVTKDVPPLAIMVGNPARQVGTVSE